MVLNQMMYEQLRIFNCVLLRTNQDIKGEFKYLLLPYRVFIQSVAKVAL